MHQYDNCEYNVDKMLTNQEAKARLAIVNNEIDVYFRPKADGYDKDENNKPLSAKHFDDLFKERANLSRQLGII